MTTFVFFWGLERVSGLGSFATLDLLWGLYAQVQVNAAYAGAMARVYALQGIENECLKAIQHISNCWCAAVTFKHRRDYEKSIVCKA